MLVDVPVPQQERAHHRHPVLGPDELRDDHLLHDAVRHAGQVVLLAVQHDHARLEAAAQVEQRVEAERGDVRPAPAVRALLHVLLVLDPTRRLLPLAVLALAAQLVQLHEHLVRRVVEHALGEAQAVARERAVRVRAGAALVQDLEAPHALDVVEAVACQLLEVHLVQGGGLLGVHAGSTPLALRRELGPRPLPPLQVLLEAELPMEAVVVMVMVVVARVLPLGATVLLGGRRLVARVVRRRRVLAGVVRRLLALGRRAAPLLRDAADVELHPLERLRVHVVVQARAGARAGALRQQRLRHAVAPLQLVVGVVVDHLILQTARW